MRPIQVPTDSAAAQGGLAPEIRNTLEQLRTQAISTLRQVPAFVLAARKLAHDGKLYRVLVSKENAKLVREGRDGITKTSLRGASGRFVENVDLARVEPDVSGALAGVAVQAALAEISAKLDSVIKGISDVAQMISYTNQGALQGAMDGVRVARTLSNESDRRSLMLIGCNTLLNQIGAVAGQMRAHVQQMPSPETDFWTGWKGGQFDVAERAYVAVHQDFAVLSQALRELITAYFELGEFAAARDAFSRVCDRLMQADLQKAADCARLLPYPKTGSGPERVFERFLVAIPIAHERLRLLADGNWPDIEFDFEGMSIGFEAEETGVKEAEDVS